MGKKKLEDRIEGVTASLQKKIVAYRQSYYGKLLNILENGKEACNAQDDGNVVASYLAELQHKFDSANGVSKVYTTWVQEVTSELDEQVTIPQSEERFLGQSDDTLLVKALKTGKRLLRNIEKKRTGAGNKFRNIWGAPAKEAAQWKQDIPFKKLVQYHLLDERKLFLKWMDSDFRYWISATDFFSNHDEDVIYNDESLAENLESEISQLKESKEGIKKEVDELQKEIVDKLVNIAQKTGTIEHRSSFYSEQLVDKKAEKVEKELVKQGERWQSVLELMSDRTSTIAEFLQFKRILKEKGEEHNNRLDEHFNVLFNEVLEKVRDELNKRYDELPQSKSAQFQAFDSYAEDSKNKLNHILEQALEKLDTAIKERYLAKESEQFTEQIFLKANTLKEKAQFLHEVDLEDSPPDISNREIEWRLLVVRALKEQLLHELESLAQNYEEFLQTQRSNIEEVRKIIQVNFESAIDLYQAEESDNGNPEEVIGQGIERTLAKIDQIDETVQQKQEAIKQAVIEKSDDLVERMLRLIQDGDSSELQLIDAKYRVKETAQGWRTKFEARWARLQDRFMLLSRFVWKKIKQYWSEGREFLGFPEAGEQEVKKMDIATYLTETDAKIKELPYIYRKLFNFDIAGDRKFYITVQDSFNLMKKSYESWTDGFPATFAVIGERGSGKSTYLSLVFDEFFGETDIKELALEKTYWTSDQLLQLMQDELGLEHTASKEEVVEELNTSYQGKVIVVECLQNLYLRNIHGYEAIQDLMYIISETKKNIFWIVSCSRYAWNFLDVTYSLGDYFSHIMQSDRLDRSQIESVIMNRHRSSGYELMFEPNESQLKSRTYRKLLDREEEAPRNILKERVF
ncbi:MAG: hypothetical protein U5J95_06245 [Balneolaceae bacterium]|nr:hypothetical protein [Balneolaceae bacterium]